MVQQSRAVLSRSRDTSLERAALLRATGLQRQGTIDQSTLPPRNSLSSSVHPSDPTQSGEGQEALNSSTQGAANCSQSGDNLNGPIHHDPPAISAGVRHANSNYKSLKRTIQSTIEFLKSSNIGLTFLDEQVAQDLFLQLDHVCQLLEVDLQQAYGEVSEVCPERVSIEEHETFMDNMTCEILTIRMTVNRIRPTGTAALSSSLPPSMQVNNTSALFSDPSKHLPRLEPLKFSGEIEEWPEFKCNWLSCFGKLDNDTQLQYLKPALPKRDQAKVSAVTKMKDCWDRLGRVYGDREVNIRIAKSNLKNLTPRGQHRWEKVTEMFEEVEKATDQLKVVDAVYSLADDFELVDYLIHKLHYQYQEDWDTFVIEQRGSNLNSWDKFTKFLTDNRVSQNTLLFKILTLPYIFPFHLDT